MEVQVIEKHDNLVWVSTAIGCFSGVWCSSTPVIYKKYVVEIDCDDVLTSDAIEFSNSHDPRIEYVEQMINITGFVEEIRDEIMIIRLQKSLLMLEIVSGFDFIKYIGRYVHVILSEIKLYDTGIY